MIWIVLALLAIVAAGTYVRRAAARVRKEMATRKQFHISIKIAGDAMASRADLAERNKLEDAIVGSRIGFVTDSGSGGGYMDLVIAVADPQNGEAQLREALSAAGLLERTELKAL